MNHHEETARDRIIALEEENKRLREALKPFASYAGEPRREVKKGSDGILYERGASGQFCLPDSHGFSICWAIDGPAQFTAGQFRRARAALGGSNG